MTSGTAAGRHQTRGPTSPERNPERAAGRLVVGGHGGVRHPGEHRDAPGGLGGAAPRPELRGRGVLPLEFSVLCVCAVTGTCTCRPAPLRPDGGRIRAVSPVSCAQTVATPSFSPSWNRACLLSRRRRTVAHSAACTGRGHPPGTAGEADTVRSTTQRSVLGLAAGQTHRGVAAAARQGRSGFP